jgi:SAM-dependent methyltransferase
METAAPPYFDFLLEAFRRGETGRFVHLGHWNLQAGFDPDAPPAAGEFELAQSRLNAYLLGMAQLRDGQSVLDAGCGFGGTLETVNQHHAGMALTGINIDPRQLGVCRQLQGRNGNRMDWELADACALPFADASFDRVLCVEAMFHFASRRAFFAQAARVLRPGGLLVASDVVLTPVGRDMVARAPALERDLLAIYGPWPDFAGEDADHRQLAAAAGLRTVEMLDATANTVRSHRFTVPSANDAAPPENPALRAAWVLRKLHREGGLAYLYLAFAGP